MADMVSRLAMVCAMTGLGLLIYNWGHARPATLAADALLMLAGVAVLAAIA